MENKSTTYLQIYFYVNKNVQVERKIRNVDTQVITNVMYAEHDVIDYMNNTTVWNFLDHR